MTKHSLKIETGHLKLEVKGDQETVRRSYEAARDLILHSFRDQIRETLKAPEQGAIEQTTSSAQAAAPVPSEPSRRRGARTITSWAPSATTRPVHMSVALSSRLYNKICLVERDDLDKSMFAKPFRLNNIQRIYLRHDQRDKFETHFPIGKILWRELTSHGCAAVRQEG